MFLSQYAKQAWHQARTNVTYTILYVLGVTLAMMFTMTMAMVLYVRIAPLYPEINRNNTYYINFVTLRQERSASMGPIGQMFYTEYLSKLKNIKYKTLIHKGGYGKNYVMLADGSTTVETNFKEVSDDFFKVFDFDFIAGREFTPEENFMEKPSVAIITDRLAEKLFDQPDQAIGRTVTLNRNDYKVVGVVRGASYLTDMSYAQIYVPMKKQFFNEDQGVYNFSGNGTMILTTRDKSQAKALEEEIQTMLHKINNSDIVKDPDGETWEVSLESQPMAHWSYTIVGNVDRSHQLNTLIWLYVVIVLVLLIVPAINLSGLIGGRMDTRLSELGIRKTYGAPRSSLMRQVIFENLFLTLTGAILGMAGAWILVTTCRHWVFSIFDQSPTVIPEWADVAINPDMLFTPALFAVMLVLCLTVNMLSAIIPAWIYMRKPIVTSLYDKR